jgi:hypothetical protein
LNQGNMAAAGYTVFFNHIYTEGCQKFMDTFIYFLFIYFFF